MANRTFQELFTGYLEATRDLHDFNKAMNADVDERGGVHPYDVVRQKQLTDRLGWFHDSLGNFGKGKIIEISGYLLVAQHRNKTIKVRKAFKFYLTAISLEDASQFFKEIVIKKYSIEDERTISFKEIPTGVLLT